MSRAIRSLISRRDLVRNTALMTVLGPVLRSLEARAAAPASPRRVILIFSPNGPMQAAGPASGSERAFTLHDWWKPLERHKADGIFLSHMAPTGARVVPGGGHGLGGQMFSGYGAAPYLARGETIDQVIGKRLEAEGRAGVRRSVVWGTSSTSRSGGTGDAFYSGPGRTISPEVDPQRAWTELFSRFMAPAASGAPSAEEMLRASRALSRDKSVLDFLNEDCKALAAGLGAEGARKLDEHCTTIRGFERSLGQGSASLQRCTRPTAPGARDWSNPEQIDAQASAFIDLIAASLACELTRVVAFQFGGQSARNRLAGRYGVPSSPRANSGDAGPAHHPWTHQRASATKVAALKIFTTFYATQVAALVDKLKSTSDAHGRPLLDSTLVVWASELGGNAKNTDDHQTGSLPVVVFGNGQGTFKTGRYLRGKSVEAAFTGGDSGQREAGRDMARLLVSVLHYMGLTNVSRVGATDVSGPLAALAG